MTIHLATDHAGFTLKETVKAELLAAGYTVHDHGAAAFDETDDYPDYIHPAARAVAADKNARGIIFGGSGQGEAMVANRYHGVRATVFYGEPATPQVDADGTFLSLLAASRIHNNANVLSIGARYVSYDTLRPLLLEWLETPFKADERHVRRINKIDDHGGA